MAKNKKFEESLQDLENTVAKLEDPNIALEDMMGLYEKGIQLSKYCTTKLNEVKNKINVLTEENENMVIKPLDLDSDVK
jgi:exodeoxyribonuclease VII small subunit